VASSARVHRILELTNELSRDERHEVAAELLAELEPHEELTREAWNRAWSDEIERRAADPDRGVPWEDARARLDARLVVIRAERHGR